MTLEIRQMVIKSNIDKSGADKPASEARRNEPEQGDADPASAGQRMRQALQAEIERLRER